VKTTSIKHKLPQMIHRENNYLDPVSIFQTSNTICLKSESIDELVCEHMNSLYVKKKGSN